MFSPAIDRWVVSSNTRPAPEIPCLASITTSAISPARASGARPSREAVGEQPGLATMAAPAPAPLVERPDGRCGGWVRVGDDGGIDPLEAVDVQLLDGQPHAVAGVELIKAPADLRAPGDGGQLEPRMAPQQVGGERPGEAGGSGDDHARGARREQLPRGVLSHGAHPRPPAAWR